MENNEAEQALQNLAEYLTKAIQPLVEVVKNMYNTTVKYTVKELNNTKNKKIKKYIRIYNKTKKYRVKKKQIKLIVRELQKHFVK